MTLILSAALTHSPETLVFAFFDFKGKTTANVVAGLPNVVAAMGNLKDDSLWIERMGDVINGELERRKSLLDRAGSARSPSTSTAASIWATAWSRCPR